MNYDEYVARYKNMFPDASAEEIQSGFTHTFGIGEALSSGIAAGGYGIAGSFGSLGEMAGLPTGDWARTMYGRAAEFAMPEELRGSILEEPEIMADPRWWAHGVGQILPSLATTIMPAMGGMKLATMLGAGPRAANLFGTALGSMSGSGMEMGHFYEETKDPMKSLAFGAGVAGLNLLPTHHMLNILTGKYGRAPLAQIGLAGLAEGIEEWGEEPLGAAIKGEDIWEAMKEGVNVIPPSIIAGMLPGSVMVARNELDASNKRLEGRREAEAARAKRQYELESTFAGIGPDGRPMAPVSRTDIYAQQTGGGSWVDPEPYKIFSTGKTVGAPDQAPFEQIQSKAEDLLNATDIAYRNWPEAVTWYEQAGALIDQLTHGDPALKERVTRLVAYLSPQNQVPENWREAVETAYQAATGNISMVHLQMSPKDIQNAMYAPEFNKKLRGVGDKVENFYRNLRDPAFGRNDYPDAATFDLWMARILGYKNDSLSGPQYDFAKKLLNQVTQEFNKRKGTNLLPRQVQALLWSHAQHMSGEADPGYNFPATAGKAAQNVTWEARPSTVLKSGKRITAMSPEAQAEFTAQSQAIISDGRGGDKLADALGIPLYTERLSEGGYEQAIAPNVITSLQARKPNGAYDKVAATTYARALQYIYSQDAVPFFRADPTAEIDHDNGRYFGMKMSFEAMSQDIEERVFQALRDKISNDIGFTRIGNDIIVVNYPGNDGTVVIPDAEFDSKLVDLIESGELGNVTFGHFTADSEYLGDWNDWQENWGTDPTGEKLLREIEGILSQSKTESERSDILARLRRWRKGAQELAKRFDPERDLIPPMLREQAGAPLSATQGYPSQQGRTVFGEQAALVPRETTPDTKPSAYLMNRVKEPVSYRVREKSPPKNTVRGYKLFQTKKGQPGKLFPLFIGSSTPIPVGKWLDAKYVPTKGFSPRPGWHFTLEPNAPHLKPDGRVWAEVEISADKDWQDVAEASPTKDIRDRVPEDGFYTFPRPKNQGGVWRIGGSMKILRVITDDNQIYAQDSYNMMSKRDLDEVMADVAVWKNMTGKYEGPVTTTTTPITHDRYIKKYSAYEKVYKQNRGYASTEEVYAVNLNMVVRAPMLAEMHEISNALDDVIEGAGLPDAVRDAFDVIAISRSDLGIAAYTPAKTSDMFGVATPPTLVVDENWLRAISETSGDQQAALREALREVLTHELGHAIDIDAQKNVSSTWDSPLFRFDGLRVRIVPNENAVMGGTVVAGKNAVGPIMREAINVMNNKQADKDGLVDFMMYPMKDLGAISMQGGTIYDEETFVEYKIDGNLRKNRPDIADYLDHKVSQISMRLQAELFAQLHALYNNRPALLKKYMPKAYTMMQEVHDGITKAGTIADVNRAVRVAVRSPSAQVRSAEPGAEKWDAATGRLEGGAGIRGPGPGVYAASGTVTGDTFGRTPPEFGPQVQDNFAGVQERVGQVGGEQTAFERKRGVISNEMAAGLASALGTTTDHILHLAQRDLGDIDNVETLIGDARAIRSTWEEGQALFKTLSEKRRAGTISQEDIAQAGEVLTRMAAISSQFFGVRGEVGRALQIFRTTQDAVQKAEFMVAAMKGVDSEEQLLDAIDAMSTIEEPGKAAKAARELYALKASDYFMEWYYMALLSGVPTHVVNIVSTGIQGAVNEVDKVVASAIGGLLGSEDRITLSELTARLGAVFKGGRLGTQMFGNVMRNFEKEDYVEYGEQKVDRPQKRAIPGIPGKIIRLPTRFLSAEDAFWKGTFYTMGLAQEAQRVSNLTGQSAEELLNNPTEEMRKNAWREAEQSTFTERGGDITKALQRFRKAHPIFSIVFPFVQTPGNIIKTAVKHTLAAPLFKEVRDDIRAGGRRRDMAVARVATGTMIMGTAVSLALQGAITGQPPEDPNERRLWYQQGNQPYSVRIGDTWVSFSRLEPFGILLGTAADMVSMAQRSGADDAEETWAVMVGSAMNNLTSKTYLRGLSDIVTMIQDPERYSERYFQRFLSTLAVPTGVAYVARAYDDRARMVNSLPDAIKARLPYLRNTLPERLDISGEPLLEDAPAAYRMVSPAYLKKVKDDPVARELMKYDVSFPAIGKKYRGVELKPEDRNELIKMAGKPTYAVLKRIVQSRTYQAMPDPIKKYTLQRVIDKLRSGARKYWAVSHPEIMREAAQLAREQRYGR